MSITFQEGEGRNQKKYVDAYREGTENTEQIGRATKYYFPRWEVVIKKTGERIWVNTLDEAKEILERNL